MNRQYLVNCDLSHGERDADYSLLAAVKPFKAVPMKEFYDAGGGNGNVKSDLRVDRKTGECSFGEREFTDAYEEKYASFYEAIPSALLMYRLACLFEGSIEAAGQEGYKVVWSMALKHEPSGEFLTFGEWKGGALFWTKFMSHEKLPKGFKKDTLALLEALLSKQCPHPYDGLVAGGVA